MAEGARFVVLDRKVFETDRLTETVTSAHHRQSRRTTEIVRAALVLTQFEHKYIR
jgi:hypothetical protein